MEVAEVMDMDAQRIDKILIYPPPSPDQTEPPPAQDRLLLPPNDAVKTDEDNHTSRS